MVTHKAMAGAPVLKNRKGFISENERVCTFQRELRSALRKGGMVLEGSLESTDCLGEVGKLFCKGQIVNSPQRVKVCLEWSLGTTRSLLWMHTCVIKRFTSVRVHVTLWTVAHQAPLSLGFSRQEYWSGFLGPPPGDLPDLGIEPTSLMSPALAAEFLTTSPTWEPHGLCHSYSILL